MMTVVRVFGVCGSDILSVWSVGFGDLRLRALNGLREDNDHLYAFSQKITPMPSDQVAALFHRDLALLRPAPPPLIWYHDIMERLLTFVNYGKLTIRGRGEGCLTL